MTTASTSVLSIDLAARRYRDNGIVILTAHETVVQAELIDPANLGLSGEPSAHELARRISDLAGSHTCRLILLDGPQGWKSSMNERVHQRECEALARTPGKTGTPNVVKPASWTRMARFSIEVFDALHGEGWPRLSFNWTDAPAAVETFPTHAWRTIGVPTLPAKRRKPNLEAWLGALRAQRGLRCRRTPNHDELQAIVAGMGGLDLFIGGIKNCAVLGRNPHFEDGSWREGLIICPTSRAKS